MRDFISNTFKKILCICLLLMPGTIAFSQLTLDQCQEKARANYPLIRQMELIDKSAEFSISNANKAYLPQISLTAIEGYLISGLPAMAPGVPSENGSFKFIGIGQLNQTLWDGGATRAQKEIIQSNVEVDKANIEVSLYAIKERVNQLYFGVLVISEQLKQLEILKQNLERNLNRVQLSVNNGLAYTSDADEVKVELLKIEQRRDEFTFTRKAYLSMLGLMIGEQLLDGTELAKPVVSDFNTSLTINRPELSLYSYQRHLAEEQNKMSKANYMPKIGLLAFGVKLAPGAAFGAGSLESLSIAGVSVSWNTMGLYRDKNNREQTKINMDRIQNQQETFVFNANLQLAQQSNEIDKQKSILAKDAEIMSLRTAIKKAYETKHQNGVCSVNDLILAINSESDAASNKALHEIQLMLSVYNYKTISGN